MIIEQMLLSKVLDEKTFYELSRYNITSEDFTVNKDVYEFIKDYAKNNKGSTPDYRTVVDQFEDFEYFPEVADTFQFMCNNLKANTAKLKAFDLLQKQAVQNFSTMKGDAFVNWLAEESCHIRDITSNTSNQGSNYAQNGNERLQWYLESKENRSNIFVPTPYPKLTQLLAGGGELGDYLLIMAYTNRGKSWIASHFGLHAFKAGFGVMHYSPELSKKQQMNRLDTLFGHFNNVNLRNGTLENEEKFEQYLSCFHDGNETPYIIKTMEDLDKGLNVDVIEADLANNPELKVCIIDGFNLMTHAGRDGNRNNMSNTSRRLRQIFAKYGVLGIVVHQTNTGSEKDSKQMDEVGNRLVKPPKLESYSETVATIQDACTVLTFDQSQGLGAISIEKARQPCVGEVIELLCNFNLGYIDEMATTKDNLPF